MVRGHWQDEVMTAVRQAYVHEAVLETFLGDEGAPGAAITTALCGAWEHEPPCPLAPHYTGVEREDDRLRLRVLFAAAEADEPEVRRRLTETLERGSTKDREGHPVTWSLATSRPSDVREEERDHAQRLAQQ
jgi:hypothetical protein